VDEGMTTVTQSDAIMGTPSYIPPEAVTRMHFDERSDLYSLGVILYETVAGRLPFDATTVQAMLRQHAYDTPKPLPDHLPPQVTEILFRLLEKEPERRQQTAVEVHEALLSLTGIPERGTPLPISRRAQSVPGVFPTPSTASGSPALDQTMSLGRRGRPWIALGIIGVALSAAAVLIASGALSGDDSSTTAAPPPVTTPAVEARPAEPVAPVTGSLPAPAAAMVELVLESDPSGAEVVIGGEVVGRTPARHQVPKSTQPLAVEFRRTGFKGESKEVVPDQDGKRVAASLDRLERKPATAKSSGSKTSGKTAKSGNGGKTSGKTGAGSKTATTPEKTPTKPPVKFVP